jgi:hypothetical protein
MSLERCKDELGLFCRTADQLLFRHYVNNTSPTDERDTMMNVQAGKIVDLKGGLTGGFREILLPSDGAYDSARQIWNAMIDKRPRSSLAAPPRRTSSAR